MTTFELVAEMQAQECINCGITFAYSKAHDNRLRETHANFFCPNGHSMCYTGKTEAEKLRDELTREKHRTEQAQADAKYWREAKERAVAREQAQERRVRAHKGIVTKLKKRVANGVCPCCHAKFKNLRDHMRAAHPDWDPEKGAEVIAGKNA